MELSTHERRIFGVVDGLREREKERASDVGEDRQEIGDLLELTGLNKRAFAFVRSLDKLEEDKRNDVLRSLDPLLVMFQRRWDGQTTPDMFDAAPQASAVVEDRRATPDEVEGMAGEFDEALDALEEDDSDDGALDDDEDDSGEDEPGPPNEYEEAALRNHGFGRVVPFGADAA